MLGRERCRDSQKDSGHRTLDRKGICHPHPYIKRRLSVGIAWFNGVVMYVSVGVGVVGGDRL